MKTFMPLVNAQSKFWVLCPDSDGHLWSFRFWNNKLVPCERVDADSEPH